MNLQQIEVDSIADLHVPLEDEVVPDAVGDIAEEEVLLEPEGEALDEAEDLGSPDAGTPSWKADSVSATAGMSLNRTLGLLSSLSHRIVPSWLGWPGWESSPLVASRSLGQPRSAQGGSRSVRTVDRVPDSSGIPVWPQIVDTPRNVVSQGQFRQGGRLTAPPGTLFGSPLGTDREHRELAGINPVYAAPAVVDHTYVDSFVQGSSSAGMVPAGAEMVDGTGQSVFVPTAEAATAVVLVGSAEWIPAQSGFQVSMVGRDPAYYTSARMGHMVPALASSMELVPAYAGPVGYVGAAPTTMVSSTNFGNAYVGSRQPVPVPAGVSGPGTAGIVPFATKNSMGGSVGSPVVSSGVHPSVAQNTVPVAGPSGSAGVLQSVPGTVRGARPVSRAAALVARVANGSAPGRQNAGISNPARASTFKNLMKLSAYDGTGSLETFLAKFTRMDEYMKWDESNHYYHLCPCLEGAAGQVLWDAGPNAMVTNIIALLRTRFGNELQAERFRAELGARRRQPRESLQQLYLDISKLVALAYLAATLELSSHVAKEAFIEALEDPQLQLKVMERKPKLVENALNIATRLEAYDASLAPSHYDRGSGDHKHKPKLKSTYAVEGEEMPTPVKEDDLALIRQRLNELQTEYINTREEIGRVKVQKEDAERRAV